MGLGKTLQAISLLAGIKKGVVRAPGADTARRPHLVDVPPSLLFNWESEIRRFFPRLAVVCYAGAEHTTDFGPADVVLTSYGEYLAILDLALPGLLGDGGAALSATSAAQIAGPALERFVERTRPFVLRRTKDEILSELPPKVETDLYIELSEQQKSLYQRTIASVRADVDAAYRTQTEARARIIALTAILRLRQICVAPQLVEPGAPEPSPKIGVLVDQLHELIAKGHGALVFSQFTSFLDLLEPHLSRHAIAFLRLDGSTLPAAT